MKTKKPSTSYELNRKGGVAIAALFAIVLFSSLSLIMDSEEKDLSTSGDCNYNMNSDVTLTDTTMVYSGAMVTAMSDADWYTLTGNTGIDAGDYVAIATLDDPVNTTWSDGTTEPKTINWTISPKALATNMVASINYLVYTGDVLNPKVSISDGETALVLNKDYTVSYKNNVNAGAAKALITGIGNYTGTIEKTFNIVMKNISIPIENTDLKYNGFEQHGALDGEGYALAGETSGIGAGFYTVRATLIDPINTIWEDGYSDEKTIIWEIEPKVLTNGMAASIESMIYTGGALMPGVDVIDGETTLVLNKDYLISYTNNTNVGVAKAVITGIGNFTGTMEKSFSIIMKDITIPVAEKELRYNGNEQFGIFEGAGYLLAGDNFGINAGSYTVTLTLCDATNTIWSDGTVEPKTIIWSISQMVLTDNMISPISTMIYSGNELMPVSEVKNGDLTLFLETDYNISYTNNVNAGVATAIITGIGNYSGTIEKTFNIVLKGVTVPPVNGELIYSGFAQVGVENGDGYTLTGATSGIGAGNYVATASLIDTVNTAWLDGTTEPKTISWTIAKETLTIAYSGENVVYGISPSLTLTVSGFVSNENVNNAAGYVAPTITNENINAGTYTLLPFGGSADNYDFEYIGGTLVISKKVIQIPVPNAGLVYNGTEQIGVSGGDGYMLSGNIGSDAGSYEALVALTDASITSWPNGSTEHEAVEWSIAAKTLNMGMMYAPVQIYTGYAIEPVAVMDGGTQLFEGIDYTISYTNNIEEGSAAAAVTGIGNYAGTVPVAFKIAKNYVVSFSLNGFEGVAPGPRTILGGSLLELEDVKAPVRAGYQFGGWSMTPGGDAMSEYTVFSNSTLYAAWKLNIYDDMPFDELNEIISQNDRPAVQIRATAAGNLLDNAFFEGIAEAGKPFTVNVLDENEKLAYSWSFEGEYRSEAGTFRPKIYEADPGYDLESLIDSSNYENPLVLNFAASGVLPIDATVTYNVGDIYADGTKLSVFFYDEDADQLKEKQTVTVTNGSVTFGLTHCSKYVMAEAVYEGPADGNTMLYIVTALIVIAIVDILAVYGFFVRRS
ncbi:MAG: MBG domain-containing protein [Methanomassiliicoccaceae archaeon]|nr:MBG domain-containing protein [Methanomassiliicoccaceae archaeon]